MPRARPICLFANPRWSNLRTCCPCGDRIGDPVVIGERGQDDDAAGRVGGDDQLGGGHAVEHRHRQVHQDHVGLQLCGEFHRLCSVGCLSDHRDVGGGGEQRGQAGADQPVIVDGKDIRHAGCTRSRQLVPAPGAEETARVASASTTRPSSNAI